MNSTGKGNRMAAKIITMLLWAYVINLGIALGAGLYESRIEAPRWLTGSEAAGYQWNRGAAVEANVGLRFWAFVTTGPLTLLTLAGLAAVWFSTGPVRFWWLLALGAGLVDRAMTFGYFIPTMIRLMSEGVYSQPEAAAKALEWIRLGNIRHIANGIGLLAAMKAFSAWSAARITF
jgi:hypothetical protein